MPKYEPSRNIDIGVVQMKNSILFLIIFLVFLPLKALAQVDYPNANDFVFPEYEVAFTKAFDTSLNEVIRKSEERMNYKELKDYILNFEYNLKENKDKYYTIYIITELKNAIVSNLHTILNDPEISKFIEDNEKTSVYDEKSVWKKIIAWSFTRTGMYDIDSLHTSEAERNQIYAENHERRNKIMRGIIENSSEYAQIADFIMTMVDHDIYVSPSKDKVQKIIDKNVGFLNKYKSSEFSALIENNILNLLIYNEEYDKVVSRSKEILKKYKNFYVGYNTDFYSIIYITMTQLYKQLNQKDKIKDFVDKINKNIGEYDKFIKSCSEFLK